MPGHLNVKGGITRPRAASRTLAGATSTTPSSAGGGEPARTGRRSRSNGLDIMSRAAIAGSESGTNRGLAPRRGGSAPLLDASQTDGGKRESELRRARAGGHEGEGPGGPWIGGSGWGRKGGEPTAQRERTRTQRRGRRDTNR